jgi:hypothetical protein
VKNSSQTSCFQTPTECANWFSDPNKATDYSCSYGTHAVDLSECAAYAPTFRPGSTGSSTVYGDPSTGIAPSMTPDTSSDPSGLAKLFVPSQASVQTLQDDAANGWNGTTPGKIAGQLSGITAALGALTDGGCGGVTVDLSGIAPAVLHLGSYSFLPACPGDFFAPWAPLVKGFLVITVTFAAVMGIRRMLGAFVQFGDS